MYFIYVSVCKPSIFVRSFVLRKFESCILRDGFGFLHHCTIFQQQQCCTVLSSWPFIGSVFGVQFSVRFLPLLRESEIFVDFSLTFYVFV